NIEFISTAPDIRNTMENLLRDLPEHEFVLWCIDDRFPISIFEPSVLRAVLDFVSHAPSDVDSIKLTDLRVEGIQGKLDRRLFSLRRSLRRMRSESQPVANDKTWREREEDTARTPAFEIAGQHFFRQLGSPKNGFYMPQFTTPAFLKRFFFAPALPQQYGIREFHHFL